MADDLPDGRSADSEPKDPMASRASGEEDLAEVPSRSADSAAWSNLWQVPAIVFSLALIGVGIRVAMQRAPADDFDGALAQVEQFISGNHLDLASSRLTETIAPNLDEASQAQNARYHAIVADWLTAWQQSQGISVAEHNGNIDKEYATAVELGMPLEPVRLERWADALIDLGRIAEAQMRLDELDALDLRETAAADVRVRRNRVLRRLVEFALRQQDLSYDALMSLLGQYRDDERLTGADQAWAIARQVELRLEAGRPQEAVDQLLVDMRRLESRIPDVGPVDFSELYTLLGRGYYDLGSYDYAEHQLNIALELMEETDSIRGLAMVLLGQIDVYRGNLDEAFGKFDLAVRDYPDAHSFLPALLQRAEVRSVLGDHDGSRADYDRLIDLIIDAPPRRDVTLPRVARSLCDRHDAALATGRLALALDYVLLAQRMFDPAEVPADVLLRIASTSRQSADDLIAKAKAALDRRVHRPEDIPPAVRHEANVAYQRAGDYYVRHARVMMILPGGDEDWADSLWRAADSYDLGGRPNLAIKHLLEYLAGRATTDPRRAELTYRLARAYQADREFESAVEYYRQVIAEHPRSPFASQSFVPQAECLVQLGRAPQAKDLLMQVVAGSSRVLTPSSLDYRNALVALGTIHHDEGEYSPAIERLSEATQRYPDHPRFGSILFRLADSYRGSALEAGRRVVDEPTLPPVEQQRLLALRREHLEKAADLFDAVCEHYDGLDPEHLDTTQLQFQRNAHLNRGDCVFELGRWTQAIEFYDYAARAHSGHYSSLIALIQIENCYWELGDVQRANTANERVRVRLEQLPEEAFVGALMNRGVWERWLENNPPGRTASADAGSSP
ncbi:MAG: tetratricopeptide repeat protein [Phycisphaerales bacterium]|nr:MAG: tetratricopeptide repeat protein [Phycisphaerales bacterium]